MENKEITTNNFYRLVERIAGILIIIILVFLFINEKNKVKEQITLNESLNDTIQVWKGKDGLSRAKISILETENTETFLNLKTKDSQIIKLQADVKKLAKYIKKQGSITHFESETRYDTIYKEDTIRTSKVFGHPIISNIDNYWIKSSFGFTLNDLGDRGYTVDNITFTLQVNNSYSILLGREPTGLLGLGKGKPFVQIRNNNPYSKTKDLRTYRVTAPPSRRWGLGVIGGYGITSDLNLQPIIGLGVSYNFITF